MTKQEFLDGLKRALSSTGDAALIAENERFYSSYIDDETAKGRSLEDVMEELGDPRLIANSILTAEGFKDTPSERSRSADEYESQNASGYEEESRGQTGPRFVKIGGWKVWLIFIIFILIIIGIISLIFTAVGQIFKSPILFSIALVLFFMWLFSRKGRR